MWRHVRPIFIALLVLSFAIGVSAQRGAQPAPSRPQTTAPRTPAPVAKSADEQKAATKKAEEEAAGQFDSLVRPLLSADRLVYGGFSAGVCVATPSLRGIEFLDEPFELAEGYPRQPIWEGLGLIDYHVAVHYRPGHPEVEPIQRTVRYFREHGMPYVALRDGEVIVVKGNDSELIR